jgi:hypothetical protein
LRVLRVALFIAGFSLALLGSGWLIRLGLDRASIEPLETRHGVAAYYNDRVEALGNPGAGGVRFGAALLGDSMVVSYPDELQIARMLELEVARRLRGRPPVRIWNLGLAGTGVFDYYFMADVIAAMEPQLVIIEFDLSSTSRRFRSAFSRPELAGWMEPGRFFESILLPLNWVGLTFDRLLLYSAIVRLGGFDAWSHFSEEQTRVEVARRALDKKLAFRVGVKRNRTPEEIYRQRKFYWKTRETNITGTGRYTAKATRLHYGPLLDGLRSDDPNLVMLSAAIKTFRSRGIDVLVYSNPINIDHIQKMGLLDPEKLAISLDHVEQAVRGSGATYLDLHDAFSDDAFRDQPGHFAFEGEFNGPAELARLLAPPVVTKARNSAGRPH